MERKGRKTEILADPIKRSRHRPFAALFFFRICRVAREGGASVGYRSVRILHSKRTWPFRQSKHQHRTWGIHNLG